jgi:hypothetical protein
MQRRLTAASSQTVAALDAPQIVTSTTPFEWNHLYEDPFDVSQEFLDDYPETLARHCHEWGTAGWEVLLKRRRDAPEQSSAALIVTLHDQVVSLRPCSIDEAFCALDFVKDHVAYDLSSLLADGIAEDLDGPASTLFTDLLDARWWFQA